ncbi:MAG: helix-turn-helix transcriptional regulator [Alphaproteobacteria bacterium]|nr:helix-turn-helix transcriptional regulator [Alphaproteobacteria bacterium]MCB9690392.1 helix-turn-helix transcriptional regulator [Alphaproteobacteria bacterium]
MTVHPALRHVVRRVWCSPDRGHRGLERVIPSGGAHMVWRVGGRIEVDGVHGQAGVLAGPRFTSHARRAGPGTSVGVELLPGAIPLLFGTSSRAVAGLHVDLGDVWGRRAERVQGALEEGDLGAVEAALLEVLREGPVRGGLPLALGALERGLPVEAAAMRAGCTARTLGAWFHDDVGLAPVRWARVRRVRRAMDLADTAEDGAHLAELVGFADHAHLCRDFRAVAGSTLTHWRAGRRPEAVAHVAASDSFKREGRGAR